MKSIILSICLFLLILPIFATIHKIGDYATPGSPRHVIIHNNLAFIIGNHTGLQMANITDPTAPVAGGVAMDLGHNLNAIISEGNDIYAVGDSIGLMILSHPDTNTIVTQATYTADYNSQSVDVENHVAFIVSPFGMDMYDVTNPTNLTYLGTYDNASRVETYVQVIANTAYLMDLYGFQIVNVTNTDSPVLQSTYPVTEVAHHLTVVNGFAYLTLNSSIQIINVSDPANPQLVGTYLIPSYPSDIANSVSVINHIAYVNCASGMQVVDMNDPQNPVTIGSYQAIPASNMNSVVAGSYAYVAHEGLGLQILDISIPQNSQILGNYISGNAHSVFSAGNTSYIAYDNLGLQIVNVTDPQNPTLLGSYGAGNNAYYVTVIDTVAYVLMNGDSGNGLWMINVSNPQDPQFLGRYSTPNAKAVTIVNGRAYVLDPDLGMAIVNVADPVHPHYLGTYNTPGTSLAVTVIGNTAYIASEWSGLRIVDVTNPSNPQQLGATDSFMEAHSIAVYQNTAYVADYYAGLKIFDATSPALPVLSSTIFPHPTSRINQVFVKYGMLFVTDNGWDAIQIYDLDNPLSPTLLYDYPWNHTSEAIFFDNGKMYSTNGLYGLIIQDFGFVVPVDDQVVTPISKLSLTNYPNPFNPSTTFSFDLPNPGFVKLDIYNIRGQLVKSVVNDQFTQGTHTVSWNGINDQNTYTASGVYFARMSCNGQEITRKLVLVK